MRVSLYNLFLSLGCTLLSLTAVVQFWDSKEGWRFFLSLFSFFIFFTMLIINIWVNSKKK